MAVAIQHINSMPLSPREINPDIPEALEAITMKAMAADKEKRYPSATAMLKDLEDFRKNPNMTLNYSTSSPAVDPENEPTLIIDTNAVKKVTADKERREAQRSAKYEQTKENRRRNSSARRVAVLAGIFAVIVFLLGIFYFLYNYFIKDLLTATEDFEVPSIVGLDIEYVQNSSRYEDFNIEVGGYDYDSDQADGTILTQDPQSGRSVKAGQTITVTIAGGDVSQAIPQVVNMENKKAVKALNDLGFYNVETEFKASEDVTSGYVIDVYPGVGETVSVNSTIYLTVSKGPDDEMVVVPNLSGKTRAQAQMELEDYGLKLGEVKEVYDDQEAGLIIYQGVAAGTQVPKDFAIDVQVSKGPEPEPEPDPEPEPEPNPGGTVTDPNGGFVVPGTDIVIPGWVQ